MLCRICNQDVPKEKEYDHNCEIMIDNAPYVYCLKNEFYRRKSEFGLVGDIRCGKCRGNSFRVVTNFEWYHCTVICTNCDHAQVVYDG